MGITLYANITGSLLRTNQLRVCSRLTFIRNIKTKYQPYVHHYETFEDKNFRKKRPLSPHLSIYKPQVTTALSIMHRITGIFNSFYLTTFLMFTIFSSHDVSHYVTMVEGLELGSVMLFIIKFVLALPFCYHTTSGLRHFMWDLGSGLNNKAVMSSGIAAVIGAVALSSGLAML